MPDMVELRAVYDDSDGMTDYFAPNMSLEEWYVCDLKGRVTEGKLRKALNLLPAWLQTFVWTFRKGEKYSFSDHPYGQLMVNQGVDITLDGKYMYGKMDRSLRFILTASTKSIFTMNDSLDNPIPDSREALIQVVDAWKQRRDETRRIASENMRKNTPKMIQESHAIIDGKGFRELTQEDKDELIEKAKQEWRIDDALTGLQVHSFDTIKENPKPKPKPKDRSKLDFYS